MAGNAVHAAPRDLWPWHSEQRGTLQYGWGSVQCGSGPALQSPDPRAWEPYPTMPHGVAFSMVCPVSQVTLGRAFFYGRAADEKVQARHICPRPRQFCPQPRHICPLLGRILRRYNVQDILAPGRASPAVSRGQMWPSRGRGANGRTARCVLWLLACSAGGAEEYPSSTLIVHLLAAPYQCPKSTMRVPAYYASSLPWALTCSVYQWWLILSVPCEYLECV